MSNWKEALAPEVQAFMDAAERYERVKRHYAEAVSALRTVQEEYNSSLEAAEKAVRDKGGSQGPFVLSSVRESYDSEKLYEALGEEAFLAAGGSIKIAREYTIDVAVLKSKIVIGAIPAALVTKVLRKSYVYRNKPPAISLP